MSKIRRILGWINQLFFGYLIDATQPAREVLGTSSEGPLKVVTSGTSAGPSGDSQGTNRKIDDLMKKVFFRCNSLCFTYLLLFLLEKQICKSPKQGRPRDVYGTYLWDVPGTRWWDVLGKSPGRRSYMFLKHIKLTLKVYTRLYSHL